MDLAHASAVVTGAASGLGRATAGRLAAEGAAVVLVDLPASPGEAAAEEIRAAGCSAVFVPADVTVEDDVREAVATAAALAPLRVAVSCAGVAPSVRVLGRAGVHPQDVFERTVAVNLVGSFNLLRLAAEAMAAQEPDGDDRGVVVLTASIAAYDGQVGQAAYAASKAGVVGLTLTAARDLAQHRIRVVTLAPGIFETPMLAGLPEAARESLAAQVPHPSRLGRPEEYADLVATVARTQMLNGEVIRLDGSLRMAPR